MSVKILNTEKYETVVTSIHDIYSDTPIHIECESVIPNSTQVYLSTGYIAYQLTAIKQLIKMTGHEPIILGIENFSSKEIKPRIGVFKVKGGTNINIKGLSATLKESTAFKFSNIKFEIPMGTKFIYFKKGTKYLEDNKPVLCIASEPMIVYV